MTTLGANEINFFPRISFMSFFSWLFYCEHQRRFMFNKPWRKREANVKRWGKFKRHDWHLVRLDYIFRKVFVIFPINTRTHKIETKFCILFFLNFPLTFQNNSQSSFPDASKHGNETWRKIRHFDSSRAVLKDIFVMRRNETKNFVIKKMISRKFVQKAFPKKLNEKNFPLLL